LKDLRRVFDHPITGSPDHPIFMSLAFESDKVMFEIYREPTYTGQYRVVYFTELTDHNREQAFNDALAGEHLFDGFLRNFGKEQAKQAIDRLLERLNAGEIIPPEEIERELKPFMA
jgi:hypothetical protein